MKKALKIFLILFVFVVLFPACSKRYCIGGSFCTSDYEQYKEEKEAIEKKHEDNIAEFRKWVSELAGKEGKPVLMVSVVTEKGSRGDDNVLLKIKKAFLLLGLMVVKDGADRHAVVKIIDRNKTVNILIELKKGSETLAVGESLPKLYGKKSGERERAMDVATTAAIADLLKSFK